MKPLVGQRMRPPPRASSIAWATSSRMRPGVARYMSSASRLPSRHIRLPTIARAWAQGHVAHRRRLDRVEAVDADLQEAAQDATHGAVGVHPDQPAGLLEQLREACVDVDDELLEVLRAHQRRAAELRPIVAEHGAHALAEQVLDAVDRSAEPGSRPSRG